ncbi:MAG: type II toxin-antitoxin system HicA family toxin [Elusimicrobia bacterium]|nr:type II toxin-antitoxin system HicA family toxin [Elusimicrobiota bacterium]
MPKPVSRREMIRRFRSLGFIGPIAGAKHSFMKKDSLKIRIPNSHRGDIDISLLKEILRQAGVSFDDWEGVV